MNILPGSLEILERCIAPLSIKSIVALNGDLPGALFFEKFNNWPVFAADGAFHRLPIHPDAIVGDLDSINNEEIPESILLSQDLDQNYGDFEKTIRYAASQDALPALILGMNGGYMDHVLSNIGLFLRFIGSKEFNHFEGSCFYTPPILGQVLLVGDYTWHLPFNTKISLFGLDAAVTSQGLKWELNEAPLSFPMTSSTSNRVVDSTLKLTVHRGLLVVLIYLEDMQDAGSHSALATGPSA